MIDDLLSFIAHCIVVTHPPLPPYLSIALDDLKRYRITNGVVGYCGIGGRRENNYTYVYILCVDIYIYV